MDRSLNKRAEIFPIPLPISSTCPCAYLLIFSYTQRLIAGAVEKASRVSKPDGSDCAGVPFSGANYISEYNRSRENHLSILFFSLPGRFGHNKKFQLHKSGFRVYVPVWLLFPVQIQTA